MDGLEEFEKQLALEKEAAEKLKQKEGRHRHHTHHHRKHRRDYESSLEPKSERQGKRRYHGHNDSLSHDQDRRKHGRDSYSSDHIRYRDRAGRDGQDEKQRVSQNSDRRSDKESRHLHQCPQKPGYDVGAEDDVPTDVIRETKPATTENATRNLEFGGSLLPDKEKQAYTRSVSRDSWMSAPSGVDVDYVQRQKKEGAKAVDDAPQHRILDRELNSDALRHLNSGRTIDELIRPTQSTATYNFGDKGSHWRMTRLKGVYTLSEQSGRSIEDVAIEQFGSLEEFDETREEEAELERRTFYGKGYVTKEKPTGYLHEERLRRAAVEPVEQNRVPSATGASNDSEPGPSVKPGQVAMQVDQTTLNRLRAQLMKAKLRQASDVAKLEEEYNQATRAFSSATGVSTSSQEVVLDVSHSRMLTGMRGEVVSVETKRGRDRGLVKANDNMSVADMVREERRTQGMVGGEGLRMAERIAKDGKFDDDLEYLDENAEKLSKHVHKSGANLKNAAVHEFTKMNKILDSCPLCHHEDRKTPDNLPHAPIVSLATRVFLTLPAEPELTGADGGAVVVPIEHHANLLECGDDEWEEIRNFMKSLTRLYHDQGRDVIFYENAVNQQRHKHAALFAVPIPYELGDTAPAFFKEAILSADEVWSQHRKIIDTMKRSREGLGKSAFRKSIAKEMPYFHVWFSLDGGLGHVVEDASRWPKGDLFAREIVGGMLDVDASIIKRHGHWVRNDPRLDDFRKRWKQFDWTRILTEGIP